MGGLFSYFSKVGAAAARASRAGGAWARGWGSSRVPFSLLLSYTQPRLSNKPTSSTENNSRYNETNEFRLQFYWQEFPAAEMSFGSSDNRTEISALPASSRAVGAERSISLPATS